MLTLLFAFFQLFPAHAQSPGSWTLEPGAVLSPDPAIPFMSQSVGAPAVAYDAVRDRFMMVFESRTPSTDPDCPQGIWALGYATSPDGINWTPAPNPVVSPNPNNGAYFNCVAAHPAVFYDDTVGNGRLQVYFKSEQTSDACDTTIPSWGCDQYTGFGRAAVILDAAGNIANVNIQTTPVLSVPGENLGYPKVIRDAGTYYMSFTRYPDIWTATSTNGTSFTMDPSATLLVSDYVGISWIHDELFNPARVCNDHVLLTDALFVGGRDTDFGAVLSGGWGKATSANLTTWLLGSTPHFDWFNADEWRHWDVLRQTTIDYLIWFSEKDASGNNFIRFGSTNPSFSNSDTESRLCP